MNKPAPEIVKARYALIDEQIVTGLTSPTAIADKIKGAELFQGVKYQTLFHYCWRGLKQKGVKIIRKNATTHNHPSSGRIFALNDESPSQLKRKIADLGVQLAVCKAHQCSEAEIDLKNENQELRTENRRLKNRIEVLSRSTTPRVTARPGFGG